MSGKRTACLRETEREEEEKVHEKAALSGAAEFVAGWRAASCYGELLRLAAGRCVQSTGGPSETMHERWA